MLFGPRYLRVVFPDFPACLRVQSNYTLLLGRNVKDIVHHQRCGFELPAFFPRVISPCPIQFRHVPGVDLGHAARIVPIRRPIGLCLDTRCGQQRDQ